MYAVFGLGPWRLPGQLGTGCAPVVVRECLVHASEDLLARAALMVDGALLLTVLNQSQDVVLGDHVRHGVRVVGLRKKNAKAISVVGECASGAGVSNAARFLRHRFEFHSRLCVGKSETRSYV